MFTESALRIVKSLKGRCSALNISGFLTERRSLEFPEALMNVRGNTLGEDFYALKVQLFRAISQSGHFPSFFFTVNISIAGEIKEKCLVFA